MSLAPMRMPSSAKTTPANGCIRANSGHTSCAWRSTAGSSVNASGSTPVSASSAAPNAAPTANDQPIIRRPAAYARSASPAPSIRPTITCAAIATASSTNARKTKIWNAIWCAPSAAAPTRASTADATVNDA